MKLDQLIKKLSDFTEEPGMNEVIAIFDKLNKVINQSDKDVNKARKILEDNDAPIARKNLTNMLNSDVPLLADTAYQALVFLTGLAPINTEDQMSLDELQSITNKEIRSGAWKQNNNIFRSSSGHQFDIGTLASYIQKNYIQNERRFINYSTTEEFNIRDIKQIQALAKLTGDTLPKYDTSSVTINLDELQNIDIASTQDINTENDNDIDELIDSFSHMRVTEKNNVNIVDNNQQQSDDMDVFDDKQSDDTDVFDDEQSDNMDVFVDEQKSDDMDVVDDKQSDDMNIVVPEPNEVKRRNKP